MSKHIYIAALLLGLFWFAIASIQAAAQWGLCGEENFGHALIQGAVFGPPNSAMCMAGR